MRTCFLWHYMDAEINSDKRIVFRWSSTDRIRPSHTKRYDLCSLCQAQFDNRPIVNQSSEPLSASVESFIKYIHTHIRKHTPWSIWSIVCFISDWTLLVRSRFIISAANSFRHRPQAKIHTANNFSSIKATFHCVSATDALNVWVEAEDRQKTMKSWHKP